MTNYLHQRTSGSKKVGNWFAKVSVATISMDGGARGARGASAPLLFFPKFVFFIFSIFFFLIDCKLT